MTTTNQNGAGLVAGGKLTPAQQTALEGGEGIAQGRFAFRVVARRYTTIEAPTRPESLSGAASALLAVGAAVRLGYGDTFGAVAIGIAAVLHGALFVRGLLARRRRAAQGTPAEEGGAFVTPSGSLAPTLEKDERVLAVSEPQGRENHVGRILGGVFQAAWGVLLGGLPLTLYGLLPQNAATAVLIGSLAALGAGLFGRGVRGVFFTRGAKRVVFTDRRAIALFAPGQARVLDYTSLRYKPLVVGRSAGDATLALDVVPQSSTAPLPVMGLWGADSLPADKAAAVAQSATAQHHQKNDAD